MNTTNLIVEFLVIGIQVAFWLALVCLTIFGIDWLSLQNIKDLSTPLAALLIAISYPIGIFVDNLADYLLKDRDRQIRNKFMPDEADSIAKVRTLLGGDSPLTKLFEYQRMRIRISRSSFLNFLIISLLLPFFILGRLKNLPQTDLLSVSILLVLLCLLIAFIAYKTWEDVSEKYYRRYNQAKSLIDEARKNNPNNL